MDGLISKLKFLQNLGNVMKSQDTDCQAEPRFWAVAENTREYGIDSGYCDGTIACGTDGDTWETVDEFITFLVENDYLSRDKLEEDYDYDFDEIIELLDDSDFYTCGYRNIQSAITPNTMFLTKDECKNHIKLNDYHYKEPHTYAMTAWRSPQVSELYKILQETDWDCILKLIYEKTDLSTSIDKSVQ